MKKWIEVDVPESYDFQKVGIFRWLVSYDWKIPIIILKIIVFLLAIIGLWFLKMYEENYIIKAQYEGKCPRCHYERAFKIK